jgi:hypothetical protein
VRSLEAKARVPDYLTAIDVNIDARSGPLLDPRVARATLPALELRVEGPTGLLSQYLRLLAHAGTEGVSP